MGIHGNSHHWSLAKDVVIFPLTLKRVLMNTKRFSERLNSLSNLEIYLSLLKFWNLLPDLFYSVPRINIFLWIKLMML